MQRGNAERGAFLRSDQGGGPRMGHHMSQQGVPHIAYGHPRPPVGPMQPRAPLGRPQGSNAFQNRPPDGPYRRPPAAASHYPYPPAGMRPHAGQGMRPPPQTGMNWGMNSATATERGVSRKAPMNPQGKPGVPGTGHPPVRGQQHQQNSMPTSQPPAPRLRATDNTFEDLANVVVAPQDISAVSYVDRIRAMNALAKVGAAARTEHSPAAIKAAASAFRSGAAFKGSAYGEDVSIFVPSSVGAADTDADMASGRPEARLFTSITYLLNG